MLRDVLDPVIATWVDVLACSIAARCERGRGLLAYTVRITPLICKDARDLWRAEDRAPYLVAFCNYLFGAGHKLRYLDRLPTAMFQALPNIEGMAGVHMLAQRVHTIEAIHALRTEAAQKMDAETDEQLSEYAGYETEEYPVANLPPSVRCFVAFVEMAHLHYLAHASYPRSFCTCQRVGCTRPALMQPPDPETIDESSDAEYWTCCRDGRSKAPHAHLPSDMSFCSYGCFAATNSEFKRVVSFAIETPACLTRRGCGPTPSRLYRAALSRNSAMERKLLRSEAKTTMHYPATMADHERLTRERITMLSVDAGLLYAAECICDLPRTRELPQAENWRDNAVCYKNVVTNVRDLYLKYGGGRMTKTGNERWLSKVKDVALKIFSKS